MNAVASRLHSDTTPLRPLSRKRLAPCHSLSRPKTGSTIAPLRRYSFFADTLAISSLCLSSICDPSKPDERGVFRAIRRVFASFYNDNAYLERLRWSVDENSVGMAVLVHHSFPDPTELANGVAIVRRRFSSWEIRLVSQVGAVSVTRRVQ